MLIALAGCNSDSGPATANFYKGGRDAFEARIEKERGTPVVVNKWASWCGPCRLEFPLFRKEAEKRKGEVAFIGVNSNDSRSGAEKFLKEEPVPFKHFEDPHHDAHLLTTTGVPRSFSMRASKASRPPL